MTRLPILAYGVVSYLIFFATFLYAIGFVANLPLPTSLDGGSGGPPPDLATALAVNLLLLR